MDVERAQLLVVVGLSARFDYVIKYRIILMEGVCTCVFVVPYARNASESIVDTLGMRGVLGFDAHKSRAASSASGTYPRPHTQHGGIAIYFNDLLSARAVINND